MIDIKRLHRLRSTEVLYVFGVKLDLVEERVAGAVEEEELDDGVAALDGHLLDAELGAHSHEVALGEDRSSAAEDLRESSLAHTRLAHENDFTA